MVEAICTQVYQESDRMAGKQGTDQILQNSFQGLTDRERESALPVRPNFLQVHSVPQQCQQSGSKPPDIGLWEHFGFKP